MTMNGNPVIFTTRFKSDTHNNTYADYGNGGNDDCLMTMIIMITIITITIQYYTAFQITSNVFT